LKYLLLFLVIFVVAWRWRTSRTGQLAEKQRTQNRAEPDAITMVSCAHCGVHVPERDAMAGTHGVYCSSAHRAAAEP
jgi:uncharacterized protein